MNYIQKLNKIIYTKFFLSSSVGFKYISLNKSLFNAFISPPINRYIPFNFRIKSLRMHRLQKQIPYIS